MWIDQLVFVSSKMYNEFMQPTHYQDESGTIFVLTEETTTNPNEEKSGYGLLWAIGAVAIVAGGVYLFTKEDRLDNPTKEYERAKKMMDPPAWRSNKGPKQPEVPSYSSESKVKSLLKVLESEEESEKIWAIEKLEDFSSQEDLIGTSLFQMVGDSSVRTKSAIASSEMMPDAGLEILSRDPDPEVRAAVAQNEVTASEILLRLANDPAVLVRLSVAENSTAPKSALSRLAHDEDKNIRMAVTKNPKTDSTILRTMSESDRDARVRGSAEHQWKISLKQKGRWLL